MSPPKVCVIHEGTLLKRSAHVHQFRPRRVIVTDTALITMSETGDVTGFMLLSAKPQFVHDNDTTFLVATRDQKFHFKAASMRELRVWKRVISEPMEYKASVSALEKYKRETAVSCSVCIVGASTEVAKTSTYPALFSLYIHGWIPSDIAIYGIARAHTTTEQFRGSLRTYLEVDAAELGASDKLQGFLDCCKYVAGDFNTAEPFEVVRSFMAGDEAKGNRESARLFYIALSSDMTVPVAKKIKEHCGTEGRGWLRVVVEKPFGSDENSSEEMAESLGALYSEEDIMRAEPMVGGELLSKLMTLRLMNPLFAHTWDHEHISSVSISHTFLHGLGNRAEKFDKMGIIRDIFQPHIAQLLAMVAMEMPRNLSPSVIRAAKARVLSHVQVIPLEDAVFGQYTSADGFEAYRSEARVPIESATPTFASAVCYISMPRWQNVPFVLTGGYAVDQHRTEIVIHFKQEPNGLVRHPPPNELVVRVHPDPSIFFRIATSVPNQSDGLLPASLDLGLGERDVGLDLPKGPEQVLLSAMQGDIHAFVSRSELIDSWRIFSKLLDPTKLALYKFGSQGPDEVKSLLTRHKCGKSEYAHWFSTA